MKWTPEGESQDIEDRRDEGGSGGGGFQFGGMHIGLGGAVVLLDKDQETVDATAAEVRSLGGTAHTMVADLYDVAACENVIPSVLRDVGYAASIEYCPVIFQAYVPKRFELRITVVGQQVFAAEIHSQQTHHTRHDWRRYDLSNTPHFPHALPEEVQQLCVRLVERLELCYGAIDMILAKNKAI